MSEQPRKKKTPSEALAENAPWMPVKYEDSDAGAIQALARGDASPHQQKDALEFIIGTVSGRTSMSFRPGEDGRRDTDFAEGRRFVGDTLVKLMKVKVTLRGEQ